MGWLPPPSSSCKSFSAGEVWPTHHGLLSSPPPPWWAITYRWSRQPLASPPFKYLATSSVSTLELFSTVICSLWAMNCVERANAGHRLGFRKRSFGSGILFWFPCRCLGMHLKAGVSCWNVTANLLISLGSLILRHISSILFMSYILRTSAFLVEEHHW